MTRRQYFVSLLAPMLPQWRKVNMTWNTDQMSEYGTDAANRIRSFADDARNTAADMRSRSSDAFGRGADWASKKAGALDATSRKLVGSMSDAVGARPFLAVGIAVLAGFLIYQLFSRD
jgi:ElaB/YqjD/DUF883 family membrane-anchored ribosome-binding protein